MGRSTTSAQRDRKVQPPRPPNAWILYRSHQFKLIRQTNGRLSQATVSKLISDMWKNETEDVKRHFEQEAEKKKAQHQELYPDYRFRPKRKEGKLREKKSKCRDATLSDADDADDDDDAVSPPMPALPPRRNTHQSQSQSQAPSLVVPDYHYNMVMPQPFLIPYMPEAHRGPDGPSPPMSTVPSPAPPEGSTSPVQLHSAEDVSSSPSSPSTRPPSSAQSQASSSYSQLPANAMYFPSLPDSPQLSPNSFATQSLSTLLYRNSVPGELPPTSPPLQLRSVENTAITATPVWSNPSPCLPPNDSQNSEEAVNFNVAINQTENSAGFQPGISPTPSFDSLQEILSATNGIGVFNLSNIDPSHLLNYPHGDLEVAFGPAASAVNYGEELFADFDFDQFRREIDSFGEDSSSSEPIVPSSVDDELQSLFQVPNNPELQAYVAARQRQPSAFTQDMLSFLNFEGAEEPTEITCPPVSSSSVAPTVAPQQVRPQSPQDAVAMPIFTQMTNTPALAFGTSYVPPAGAIYSSTRRVGGSWKPSYAIDGSQMEDPVQWAFGTN